METGNNGVVFDDLLIRLGVVHEQALADLAVQIYVPMDAREAGLKTREAALNKILAAKDEAHAAWPASVTSRAKKGTGCPTCSMPRIQAVIRDKLLQLGHSVKWKFAFEDGREADERRTPR